MEHISTHVFNMKYMFLLIYVVNYVQYKRKLTHIVKIVCCEQYNSIYELVTSPCNFRHFADGILKYISFNEMFLFWFEFDWNLFPNVMA